MCSKAKFSNSCREILISEVQTKPVLWNDQHPDYKKTEITRKLWGDVGTCIGLSGQAAKGKWKNLKDKFWVELHKIPKKRSGSENDNYKSKWPFFDMLFVKDSMLPSTTTGHLSKEPENTDSEDEEQTAENVNNEESDTIQHEPSSPSTSSSRPSSCTTQRKTFATPTCRNKKRPAQNEIDRHYLELEQKKLDLLEQEFKKDVDMTGNPDYHFLMSLLPYFTDMDCLEKLEVRAKIQEVITEAVRRKQNTMQSVQRQENYTNLQLYGNENFDQVRSQPGLHTNSGENLTVGKGIQYQPISQCDENYSMFRLDP
ncbi:uncharacterized protein [Onthophagus taurus]|uniref:uncharacterized protein n=1 Tax=Onthophagus taurus TaxID=166361 RepID=UPI0039BDF67A